MSKKKYLILITALGALTALGPFSIDLYLPAFKAIAHDMNVSLGSISTTLSSYLIGISVGQLFYGPLLDRFGRRKPLYIGLILYMAATVGCCFSETLQVLALFRFFQAIGGCAATVAANAMVRDYFPVSESAKVFSFLMLVLGVSPMIAPSIGSYVTVHFGWQAIFIILFGIAICLLLVVIFILPDNYQPDTDYSLKPSIMLKSFSDVLRERQFIIYSISGALILGCLFAFISASPNLFMGYYELKESTFAWLFAALSGGFVAAGQINRLLENKFKSSQIVLFASACQCVFALIFVYGVSKNALNMPGVILMILAILICTSVALPNAAALTFAPFRRSAGTAAALFGTFEMVIGSLVSFVVTLLNTKNALTMAIIMAILSFVAFAIIKIEEKQISKGH